LAFDSANSVRKRKSQNGKLSRTSLEGKIIIVTGASRGLGEHLSLRLAQRKATLVLTARHEQALQETVNHLKQESNNQNIEGIVCDQGDRQSIISFFEQFKQRYDHLDILVNNASVMPGYGQESISDDLDELTYRVNVEGYHFFTKYALPYLFAAPKSDFERTVLFVSSSSSWLEEPEEGYGMLSYRASKAAENGLMVGLHQLYVDKNEMAVNIRGGNDSNKYLNRVVSVHPGFVATGLGRETWFNPDHKDNEISGLKEQGGAISLDAGIDTLLWLIAAQDSIQSGKHYYLRKVHSF
jgi:NAD(P)-dependent dehydrogenase (short-subunit alcohol dehydrogenase family)